MKLSQKNAPFSLSQPTTKQVWQKLQQNTLQSSLPSPWAKINQPRENFLVWQPITFRFDAGHSTATSCKLINAYEPKSPTNFEIPLMQSIKWIPQNFSKEIQPNIDSAEVSKCLKNVPSISTGEPTWDSHVDKMSAESRSQNIKIKEQSASSPRQIRQSTRRRRPRRDAKQLMY